MASRTLDAEVGKSSGSCRTCAEEEQAKSDAAAKVDRMPKSEDVRRKDPFWKVDQSRHAPRHSVLYKKVPPAPGTLQLYNRPDILDIKSSYASAGAGGFGGGGAALCCAGMPMLLLAEAAACASAHVPAGRDDAPAGFGLLSVCRLICIEAGIIALTLALTATFGRGAFGRGAMTGSEEYCGCEGGGSGRGGGGCGGGCGGGGALGGMYWLGGCREGGRP